jgi:hypothetical protein
MGNTMQRIGQISSEDKVQTQDPRTKEEEKDVEPEASNFKLENIPIEIVGIIAAFAPFRQFMALLNSTRKFRKLLGNNYLWGCQIERFFKTSLHNAKPNCKRIFKDIYVHRKKFEPAILSGFKSAYVSPKISSQSDDSEIVNALFGNPLRHILLDDTLFTYESKKAENVNVLLTTYKPFFIRSIKISGPQQTKREPLSAGLIFLFDEEPDLKQLNKFNSFTKQQWDELTSKYDGTEALQRAGCPVMYFEGLENVVERKLFINFEFPFPVASFIVLKMLRGKSNHSDRSCLPGSICIANFILYGAPADATYGDVSRKTHDEPDDIDMGGLSDYDEDCFD